MVAIDKPCVYWACACGKHYFIEFRAHHERENILTYTFQHDGEILKKDWFNQKAQTHYIVDLLYSLIDRHAEMSPGCGWAKAGTVQATRW